jgi:beta-phosphoglucomutase family hydrolase
VSVRLPAAVHACLFDLDGVLTKTATLHAQAWREMFDAYLRTRTEPFVPFDPHDDYDLYVDGKERNDGVRSFLASRGIELPENEVRALGDHKNELVLELMRSRGVEAYDDAVAFVHAVREAGLRAAVVSSSTNAAAVLEAAGIEALFDACVDARVAHERGLAGKPAPDMFVEAGRELDAPPAAAAIFEDALVGVAAGRAGAFALVVGVDRVGQADALFASGADIVVSELTELVVP